MADVETRVRPIDSFAEHDAYRFRDELLVIADALKRDEFEQGPPSDADLSPRDYVYRMIDDAAAAGYVIDNLEAIELLGVAHDRILLVNQATSNLQDGTWDESTPAVQYLRRTIWK